jgi:hypothetical protein
VAQSSFFLHFGLHAKAPESSKLVQVSPSQHRRTPPQDSSPLAHAQAAASAQNDAAEFA